MTDYTELEKRSEEELKDAIIQWIKDAAKICGTQKALAEKAGLPYRSLQTNINGTSAPGSLALIKMARASGKSLDELVWPEGYIKITKDAPMPTEGIPAEFVYRAVRELQEWLKEEDKRIDDVDFRMKLIKLWAEELYDDELHDPDSIEERPDSVKRPKWLKLVAG